MLQKKLRDMEKYNLLEKAGEILQKYEDTEHLTPRGNLESETPKHIVKSLKEAQRKRLKDRLSEKKLHGIFTNQTLKPESDLKGTHAWLRDGKLRAETE